MKIITIINWVLVGIWGIAMIYSFISYINQANTHLGSEARYYSIALLTAGFVAFFVVAGLNLLPYNWTKIIALLIGLVLLLITLFVATND